LKEIDDMVANNWEQLSELLDEKIGVRYDADKADQAKAENSKERFDEEMEKLLDDFAAE
jgi:hypothetical protein